MLYFYKEISRYLFTFDPITYKPVNLILLKYNLFEAYLVYFKMQNWILEKY
jgi:hypothetical protein